MARRNSQSTCSDKVRSYWLAYTTHNRQVAGSIPAVILAEHVAQLAEQQNKLSDFA